MILIESIGVWCRRSGEHVWPGGHVWSGVNVDKYRVESWIKLGPNISNFNYCRAKISSQDSSRNTVSVKVNPH